jgi:hypothetical protein
MLPVLLIAFGACAARQRSAAPAAAAAPLCPRIGGLAEVLQSGAVLFFGEMHGSVESPALVGDAACAVRTAGLPLVVGLEVPVEEEAAA